EDLDQLWFNDGKGHLHLAGWPVQRQTSHSAMSLGVGDISGDGIPDLFEVDMLANDTKRLKTEIPTHTALPKIPGDLESVLQQQRNTLFLNRGDGTFAEIGMLAGVGASGWSWGTMFMDVDLDGRPDILIANGHLWDIMDGDVQEGLQNRLKTIPWRRTRWQFPKMTLKNVAFRNRGDLTFEDVSDRWGFGTEADISHALAAADLDGDGDLDVVVNRLDAPALILRNNTSANRVAVRLIGDAPNTRAVGSKVKLLGGAVPLQEREVVAGGLYMSHSDYELSFAMASADSATLVVDWRDGRRSTLTGVRPHRLYEITTHGASAGSAAARVIPAGDTASHRDSALFEDATAQLGGQKHVDRPFDDWERQFLLPNSLSQLGPGVVWFDYDRDGYEDLLIGAGGGGQLGVFHNDHGRLVPQPKMGPVSPADLTGLAATAADGGKIVAGFSSWEGHPGPSAVAISANAHGVGTNGTDVAPPRVSSPG